LEYIFKYVYNFKHNNTIESYAALLNQY
jgi:hypothetical protein